MVAVPPVLGESDFKDIVATVTLLDGAKVDDLYAELIAAKGRYRADRLDLGIGPGFRSLRKTIDDARQAAETHVARIQDAYSIEVEDEMREALPDWMLPLVAKLNAVEAEAAGLLCGFPEIKRGPDRDYAFPALIHQLAGIFQRYTGERVSTTDSDDRDLPMFHCFAERCCERFGVEIGRAFDTKLNKTVITLRREGRL